MRKIDVRMRDSVSSKGQSPHLRVRLCFSGNLAHSVTSGVKMHARRLSTVAECGAFGNFGSKMRENETRILRNCNSDQDRDSFEAQFTDRFQTSPPRQCQAFALTLAPPRLHTFPLPANDYNYLTSEARSASDIETGISSAIIILNTTFDNGQRWTLNQYLPSQELGVLSP